MAKISVMIVDDHPMMREALRDAFYSQTDIEICGEAVDGSQAVEMAAELRPDVVLMDLYMPGMDGIEATTQIVRHNPFARVLVITSATEDNKVLQAIRAGAAGYILKSSTRAAILQGVRAVSRGDEFLPAEIGTKLAGALKKEHIAAQHLTPRETEILALVELGLSNEEISARLVVSVGTIRVHISNLLRKFRLRNRLQLVYKAQNKNIP
jgi:NarL family two-component system response regulator LiaR